MALELAAPLRDPSAGSATAAGLDGAGTATGTAPDADVAPGAANVAVAAVGVADAGAGEGAATVLAEDGAPAGAAGTTDTPGTVITAEASDSSNDFGNSAATNSPAI